jgi:protoporphyrinogen/coproporphyrinogen III oxidase
MIPDRTQPAPVVVVGGGISGLAAAHRLLSLAPGTPLILVEGDSRLGGKIATERAGGFLIESGPDSFLAAKPRGVGLCEELGLGGELQGITPRPHRAYVLRGDGLHELPEGLTGLVPTKLGPLARSRLLSPLGKARMALDYAIPARAGDDDESLGGFIRRRLGDEAWERLVEPLMAGIYAGDGDRLSLLATFPQLRQGEIEHGGLIRGVLAARAAGPPAPAKPAFLAPRDGLGRLVETLEARLRAAGAEIRLGQAAREIRETRDGAEVVLRSGETIPASAVIVATQAYAAGDLLAGIDPALSGDLRAIPYASSAVVSLAWPLADVPRVLEAHGYIIPKAENRAVLACTWTSQKWAGRAPGGHVLMRIFIGRFGREELLAGSDEDLERIAREEVRERLGITAPPELVRVQRWPQGMPQLVIGHGERLARIEAASERRPWLALAGNAYRGVGLPDAIASGEQAGERIASRMAGQPRTGAAAASSL